MTPAQYFVGYAVVVGLWFGLLVYSYMTTL